MIMDQTYLDAYLHAIEKCWVAHLVKYPDDKTLHTHIPLSHYYPTYIYQV